MCACACACACVCVCVCVLPLPNDHPSYYEIVGIYDSDMLEGLLVLTLIPFSYVIIVLTLKMSM